MCRKQCVKKARSFQNSMFYMNFVRLRDRRCPKGTLSGLNTICIYIYIYIYYIYILGIKHEGTERRSLFAWSWSNLVNELGGWVCQVWPTLVKGFDVVQKGCSFKTNVYIYTYIYYISGILYLHMYIASALLLSFSFRKSLIIKKRWIEGFSS